MKTLWTPNRILVMGFALFTLIGAILLWIPLAHESNQQVTFLDALFTATSAFSVTGLVVVDTATTYNLFGELVILGLIQVGGIGFVTSAVFFSILIGKRIGIKERLILGEQLNQSSLQGLIRLLMMVIYTTLIIEALGFILLSFRFVPDWGWLKGMYYALFHSVSAFNSAGFELFGMIDPFSSLSIYRDDVIVNMTVGWLMILGALGFVVIIEVFNYSKTRKLSLHTKLVLTMTSILLLLGTIIICMMEWSNPATLDSLHWLDKGMASFFHSTARTGGFSTLDVSEMYPTTLFFIIILMFIGASPGSTGGGIKVTTAIVILLSVWTMIRGRTNVVAFRRTIPNDNVYKALTITVLSMLFVIINVIFLTMTERADFLTVMFEVVSAFGTVGSSMGITPELSPYGKILIIICMFVGRLGPLTLGFAMVQKMGRESIKYPEEKLMIG